MRRILKAWVVVLPLFSVACASGGAPGTAGGSGGTQSADALNTYNGDITTEYTATGVVVGAALGCGLGLLLTGKAEYCAAGAAAGGVAGGVGGYAVSKSQQTQSLRKASLQETRSVLTKELYQAQEARRLAERLTASHQKALTNLRVQVASGRATTAQLNTRVKAAEADLQRLKKARTLLEQQIGVAASSGSKRGSIEDQQALAKIKEALLAEKAKLDEQVDALEGAIRGDPATVRFDRDGMGPNRRAA